MNWNTNKKVFPALTGIRFVAASLVFVFHYAQIVYDGQPPDFGYYFMRQLNVGVNLFFVLSGFLITHRYFWLSKGEFWFYWCKRIARIFPLYYLVLGLNFLLLHRLHHTTPDAMTLFLNITLLKGLSESYFFSVMTQSWSLTVEEMFYLYAPVCYYLIKKRGLFVLQLLTLFGLGLLLVWLASATASPTFFGGTTFLFAGTFFGRCFEFFTGIYVALLVRKTSVGRAGRLFTFAGGALFFLFVLLLAYYAWTRKIEVINDYPLGVLLFNFLIPTAIGLLLYGLVVEQSRLKNALATNALQLLGKSSYAFYLLHIGAVAEVIFFHVTANILFLYLLLQLCSIAAYKFFEKPVYFYLLRKFQANKPVSPTASNFARTKM